MLFSLALLGMLLRVAVPAGYMPASVSDGWYLQLCPDGVPPGVMVALSGHAHAHHLTTPDGDAAPAYVQCDLGGGLSSVAASEQSCVFSPPATVASTASPEIVSRLERASLRAYHSRAPPGSTSCS